MRRCGGRVEWQSVESAECCAQVLEQNPHKLMPTAVKRMGAGEDKGGQPWVVISHSLHFSIIEAERRLCNIVGT